MKLSRSDNLIVRGEILQCVAGGRISTHQVIRNVLKNVQASIPKCNLHHVSGILSGLTKGKQINCKGGFCW